MALLGARRLRPVERASPLNFSAAHVFRPPRRDGAVPPAVAAGLALALAVALLVAGTTRGISFAAFGGDVVALALLALAFRFGYWAYALYNLRYLVDDESLIVVWGATRLFVPVAQIDRILLGRKFGEPRMDGLSWPGCHVGKGRADRVGEALFYSAHRSPAEIVYVSMPDLTVGLSLTDARGMARAIQEAQEYAPSGAGRSVALHRVLPGQALLADPRALLLAGIAAFAFLVAAGAIASRYQSLPRTIALAAPSANGTQRVGPRSDLIRLPGAAFVWLLAGLGLASWSYVRLRPVSYSLLVGTVFAECLYVVAAMVAVH